MAPRNPWLQSDVLDRIGTYNQSGTSSRTAVDGDVAILEIDSLPALVQAVGYLKYRAVGPTYFRGQAKLHQTMHPSLLRGGYNYKGRANALNDLLEAAAVWSCAHDNHKVADCPEQAPNAKRGALQLIGGGVPRYAAEPLLQHYGARTRWLDLVDNLWIALWFACHTFDGSDGFTHTVRRTVLDGGSQEVFVISVTLPAIPEHAARGFGRVKGGGRLINLREAVPSFYLRPHAQHGVLLRPHDDDYRNLDFAALRIPLPLALDWLGSSILLSPFAIFPPPSVDLGYRRLLAARDLFPHDRSLGDIDLIGAGY